MNHQQNFLSPINFRFVINRLPNVAFYVQKVNIPGFTLGPTTVQTPFMPMYRHGDSLSFSDLIVTVRLDENMESYLEIYNWIMAAAKQEGYEDYEAIKGNLYSDASLVVLNSNQNPSVDIKFKEAFPYAMTDVQFDSTLADIDYPTVDITFKFLSYEISKVT